MEKINLIVALVTLLMQGFNTKGNGIINSQNNKTMENNNFKTTIVVDQSPEKVFTSINNVKGWWSENVVGGTDKLNDEFIYRYQDVHICKMKIVELNPGKKVVWLVLENEFNFTNDKSEWKNNKIVFEISQKDGKTQLDFTQIGLVPEYECYGVCRDAWTSYIQGSLKDLITTGKGKPNTKENDLNIELIEKWGLPDKQGSSSKELEKKNFTYTIKTSKSIHEVYTMLLDIKQWWFGLYEETINGKSTKPDDEFTFKAGGGLHYTKQKLIELVPEKKIVWLVTESNLSFLSDPAEWEGTKIRFDLSTEGKNTLVTFTHEGLVPQIECYDNCSAAWTGYMDNLKKALK